jgi:hypothetical protein
MLKNILIALLVGCAFGAVGTVCGFAGTGAPWLGALSGFVAVVSVWALRMRRTF